MKSNVCNISKKKKKKKKFFVNVQNIQYTLLNLNDNKSFQCQLCFPKKTLDQLSIFGALQLGVREFKIYREITQSHSLM